MMQVSLLVVMEIGLFPLICGWWLDICSLVRQTCRVKSVDLFGTATYWPVMTNQTEFSRDDDDDVCANLIKKQNATNNCTNFLLY